MSENGSNKNKFLAFFQRGKFPKYTRISLDVTWNITLFFLVLGLVTVFFMGGVGAGYFASLVQGVTIDDKDEMEQLIYNYEETSEVYFADNVRLGELRSDIHREEVALEDVSDVLIDAIIATEDEYFDEHPGIVPKAVMRALFQEFAGSSSQTGGSTLTQQLVKNQILTSEVSFERKAEEIMIALRLENFFEKDEILSAYLNVIPFGRDSSGRNIAGIQAAAEGLFDVDASELNLPQAAYIAGLPQSPYAYTPFESGGNLRSEEAIERGIYRMQVVLNRMLSADKITEEEYEEAINYDVVANLTDKKESIRSEYPYLNDEVERRARDILAKQLAEDEGELEEYENNSDTESYYKELAERELRYSGLEIHTTIDKEIYDRFQEVTSEYQYFEPTRYVTVTDSETGESRNVEVPVETGAMLMENQTGRIIAFVGGRDFERNEINYATWNYTSNGSAMKPLLGYAPAIELGLIQPGSPIPDVIVSYPNDGEEDGYTPTNYNPLQEKGIISAREALYDSDNVPAIRLMGDVLDQGENPKSYLREMGFDHLSNENTYRPDILGTEDSTVEENTNAYATFANGGEFVEGYMIERILDRDGNVIYQHEPEIVEVFSAQTAYLTIDILRDTVESGTATSLNYNLDQPNVDWAGKTGTSQEWRDAWFIGSNPNVTLGSWIGYRSLEYTQGDLTLNCSNCTHNHSNRNLTFWAQLANVATEINPELMAPEGFHESPGGLVTRSYCEVSGDLPSDACNELGLVSTDLFNIDDVPTDEDESVVSGQYVEIEDEVYEAVEGTPEEFTQEGYFIRHEFIEDKGWDNIEDLSKLIPDNDSWSNLFVIENEEPEDEGQPETPQNVTISSGTLSWSEVSGQVIGYRIYAADSEEDEYELVDHTTETSFDLPTENRLYAVQAVSLFGHESDLSDPATYGTIEVPDEEDDEEDSDERDDNRGEDEDESDPNDDRNNSDEEDENEDEDVVDDEEENEDEDEHEADDENDETDDEDDDEQDIPFLD
ncbi:transglycosylase domain-containing protein [Alkalibacillus aidingensis]|uniref:transglycosylase domain-containing protein n=1 Tax=Alkalibacillus aidingensis TaxID=2747607 RepID=UPI001660BDF8|nr:transglycosylase domain-containing protein [Alkalibacillus aidingensis]